MLDSRLGPFRIIAPNSKGATGETFVAERTESAGVVQRVCLKRILDEARGDPKWIQMFQNEARLVSALRQAEHRPALRFRRSRRRRPSRSG